MSSMSSYILDGAGSPVPAPIHSLDSLLTTYFVRCTSLGTPGLIHPGASTRVSSTHYWVGTHLPTNHGSWKPMILNKRGWKEFCLNKKKRKFPKQLLQRQACPVSSVNSETHNEIVTCLFYVDIFPNSILYYLQVMTIRVMTNKMIPVKAAQF